MGMDAFKLMIFVCICISSCMGLKYFELFNLKICSNYGIETQKYILYNAIWKCIKDYVIQDIFLIWNYLITHFETYSRW